MDHFLLFSNWINSQASLHAPRQFILLIFLTQTRSIYSYKRPIFKVNKFPSWHTTLRASLTLIASTGSMMVVCLCHYILYANAGTVKWPPNTMQSNGRLICLNISPRSCERMPTSSAYLRIRALASLRSGCLTTLAAPGILVGYVQSQKHDRVAAEFQKR